MYGLLVVIVVFNLFNTLKNYIRHFMISTGFDESSISKESITRREIQVFNLTTCTLNKVSSVVLRISVAQAKYNLNKYYV